MNGRCSAPVATTTWAACVRPVFGPHQEAGTIRAGRDRGHPHPLAHRGAERAGVGLQVGHDLVLAHEAVGIVARVGEAWQLERPVRTDQAQRVPSLAAPALGDASLLEHDVRAALLGQVVAHGEPGLPTANDDDLGRLGAHWAVRRAMRWGAVRFSRMATCMMILPKRMALASWPDLARCASRDATRPGRKGPSRVRHSLPPPSRRSGDHGGDQGA